MSEWLSSSNYHSSGIGIIIAPKSGLSVCLTGWPACVLCCCLSLRAAFDSLTIMPATTETTTTSLHKL